MLNNDTLAQLKNLKQDIRSSKNLNTGLVRGTAGRYGFVRLEDGRDVYLHSEQMERVFPGDKVEVAVSENEREQLEGKLEKLVNSPLKQLAGQYKVKGKGHFVVYTDNLYTRWVFVPPKERMNAKDGDTVTARIIQHPYKSGKPQAKVTANLGTDITANLIRQCTLASHQLFDTWSKDVQNEARALKQLPFDQYAGERTDLRAMNFVTIDAANTQDMDDALAIEETDSHWQLWVAIADPGCEIRAQSALDKIASKRAQTLYFPGKALPMLPEELSTDRYSLKAGEERLALVSKIEVEKSSGQCTGFEFIPAVMQSRAKLSYVQASALVAGEETDELQSELTKDVLQNLLVLLAKCTDQLNDYRKTEKLLINNRPDFYLKLNKQGKLESIEKMERTPAHQIVEEAMVLTNQCAGQFLAEHNTGLFSTHEGFKKERREDIETLLREDLGEAATIETAKLENYCKILRTLQEKPEHQVLLSKQQRFQSGSQLSLEAKPHFGLGSEHYATITSPIRRYQDLYNQRQIHALLEKKSPTNINENRLDALQDTLGTNRSAVRTMQQWLIADYMQDKIGETFTGHIALLTNQGIGVRLADSNIEGFVPAIKEDKKNPDKPYDKVSFNNQRLELTWNDKEYRLDQEVSIRLGAIDPDSKKLSFSWA